MGNSQLKASYNLQHRDELDYIVALSIGLRHTDTLPQLLPQKMKNHLSVKYYQKIVADAGYESEKDDVYLEANGQQAFIKSGNYKKVKSKTYKKVISRAEKTAYDEQSDSYICYNGKKLIISRDQKRKQVEGGFEK